MNPNHPLGIFQNLKFSPSPPPCRGRAREGVEVLRNLTSSTPFLTFPLQGGRNGSWPQ